MRVRWHRDLESLEAISQNDVARRLLQRMADLACSDRLEPFLAELHRDVDLDESTKAVIAEIAEDSEFLHEVDDYVRRTAVLH
jgi:hypothetical protein